MSLEVKKILRFYYMPTNTHETVYILANWFTRSEKIFLAHAMSVFHVILRVKAIGNIMYHKLIFFPIFNLLFYQNKIIHCYSFSSVKKGRIRRQRLCPYSKEGQLSVDETILPLSACFPKKAIGKSKTIRVSEPVKVKSFACSCESLALLTIKKGTVSSLVTI